MDQYWIWLTELPQIGAVTANRLLQHFSTPKDIFDADLNALLSVKQLTSRQRESILSTMIWSMQKGWKNNASKIIFSCFHSPIPAIRKTPDR